MKTIIPLALGVATLMWFTSRGADIEGAPMQQGSLYKSKRLK